MQLHGDKPSDSHANSRTATVVQQPRILRFSLAQVTNSSKLRFRWAVHRHDVLARRVHLPHCRAKYKRETGCEIRALSIGSTRLVRFEKARERWITEYGAHLRESALPQGGMTVYHNFACAAYNWQFLTPLYPRRITTSWRRLYGDAIEQIS